MLESLKDPPPIGGAPRRRPLPTREARRGTHARGGGRGRGFGRELNAKQ